MDVQIPNTKLGFNLIETIFTKISYFIKYGLIIVISPLIIYNIPMLQPIADLPPHVIGLHAFKDVSEAEYEKMR